MKNTSTIYLLCLVITGTLIGCNDNPAGKLSDQTGDTAAKKEQVADIDLLNDCASEETLFGFLQGVPESTKKRGPYAIINCNDGPNAYDLIFSLRDSSETEKLSSIFSSESKTGYGSFDVYKFSIPSKTKKEQTDYHEDQTIYPSVAKAYKREHGTWTYLGEKEVKNRGEYSLFVISNIK